MDGRLKVGLWNLLREEMILLDMEDDERYDRIGKRPGRGISRTGITSNVVRWF